MFSFRIYNNLVNNNANTRRNESNDIDDGFSYESSFTNATTVTRERRRKPQAKLNLPKNEGDFSMRIEETDSEMSPVRGVKYYQNKDPFGFQGNSMFNSKMFNKMCGGGDGGDSGTDFGDDYSKTDEAAEEEDSETSSASANEFSDQKPKCLPFFSNDDDTSNAIVFQADTDEVCNRLRFVFRSVYYVFTILSFPSTAHRTTCKRRTCVLG